MNYQKIIIILLEYLMMAMYQVLFKQKNILFYMVIKDGISLP